MGKGILLFNGGIDSLAAAQTLLAAGQDILLLNFQSPFFGGPSERLKETAKALKCPLIIADFSQQIISAAQAPKRGYGAAANPCVDCRSLMLLEAERIREKLGYDYVATGDVLKQHTFSQSADAFQVETKLAGISVGSVLRPLSQKLIGENRVTQNFVPCSTCLGISGQTHQKQEELLRAARISVRSPLKRCALLESGYSHRLLAMKQDNVLCSKTVLMLEMLRTGRLLRFMARQYVFLYKRHEAQCVPPEVRPNVFYIESVTVSGETNPHRTYIVVIDFSRVELSPEEPRRIKLNDLEDFVAHNTRPGFCASFGASAREWPFSREEVAPNDLLIEFAVQVFRHYGDRNATRAVINGAETIMSESPVDVVLLERKLIQ